MKFRVLFATALAAKTGAAGSIQAQNWTDGVIRIGMLSVMSSLYADRPLVAEK